MEQVMRENWFRRALQRVGLMTLALLAVVAVMQVTQPIVEGASLVLVGGFIAILPAALWLAIFYRQEQTQARPKTMVRTVFILSALLATAIGIPLVQNVFRVQDWLEGSALIEIGGAILIVGFSQEFLKFAAMRWTVYHTAEMDDRLAAITYATIAALGYATVLNLNYVLGNPRLDLSVAIVRVTVTVLSQAAFAIVLGYFVGRAKFDGNAAFRLSLGLIVAAILNGVFHYGRDAVNQGLDVNVLSALVLALVFAAVTLPTILYLMRRITLAPVVAGQPSARDRYAGLLTLIITLIALTLGWSLKTSIEMRTRNFQDATAGIRFDYPATWLKGTETGALVLLTDARVASTFATRITARTRDGEDKNLSTLSKEWTFEASNELNGYRVLAIVPQGDGSARVSIRYAYVAEPRSGADTSASLPVVALGEDVLILKGKRLYILSVQADQARFAQAEKNWSALIASVRLD